MKKVFLLLSLTLFVVVGFSQVPDMRTNLRYNTSTCRYEVYVMPSADMNTFYMGGSQIVVAVPHNMITNYSVLRKNAFVVTTVAPSGDSWAITAACDADLSSSYSGAFDYYAFDHSGGPLNNLTANTEILLFTFTLGQNCVDGLRLWEGSGVANNGLGAVPNNYNDPKIPFGGGDYETNFVEAYHYVEAWVGNYSNTQTSLPKPTVSITHVCDVPIVGYATITANVIGGASCSPAQYTWGGAGEWLMAPGNTNSGVGKPNYGNYTVSVIDNNGCGATGDITILPNCSLASLPVELISFTVKKEGKNAFLEWATATEVNNNYFDVEHSTDAEKFNSVGKVYSPNGNSSSTQHYNYTHYEPAKGVNYYRLKQVDYDGAFEYTDVRSVVFGSVNGLTVYPNPVNSTLKVKVPEGMDESSVVEILNAAGQVIRSVNNYSASSATLEMNVSDLALGYYFIQIKTASDLYREQFVISR